MSDPNQKTEDASARFNRRQGRAAWAWAVWASRRRSSSSCTGARNRSFKRSGEMIATPRVTFATSGVSADTRATYLKAINASLDACIPMKFTDGLGGAVAGRPIAIRYVDNRELGKVQTQSPANK